MELDFASDGLGRHVIETSKWLPKPCMAIAQTRHGVTGTASLQGENVTLSAFHGEGRMITQWQTPSAPSSPKALCGSTR
jgi:hypothetical protein